MKDEAINLSRFGNRVMKMITSLVLLNEAVREYSEDLTEEKLNSVYESSENLDRSSENLKNSLLCLLKEINNTEDIQIEAEETENGFEV